MNSPAKLFYSYSHADEALRDELDKHLTMLRRQNLIEPWHDRCIPAGSEWAGEIDENLESADVILLLVSADFLTSNYCYEIEMNRAMERHEQGDATVIPVILRPCDWQSAPFGRVQGAPKNAEPITTWKNQDEAFVDAARYIRKVVEQPNP